ncbi:VIT domain-containing protein [Candidatus Entotheonella palauensis]|uniref:VIT domain-containing protein n=1 Tax=Candidatus Entotheonella palauensis TaxID=93172 RepID=UPI000B7D1DC6|nr:VIT domain-containing protein [Candidatus Entotheonella palauensis]
MTLCQPMSTTEYNRVVVNDDEMGFGALSTARGHLPLKTMAVQVNITGLVSEVTVHQTFLNTGSQPLEATYIFPLPSRAAVTHFRMDIGDRIIDGQLKERAAARQDYDKALAEGHRAAIAEAERSNVFTVRVGNLMPGEVAATQLTLSGPLTYVDGEATFRFPLVVAPRYIPGIPLPDGDVGDGTARDTDQVPDASRISPPVLLPGFPNPIDLTLAVELDPLDLPLLNVRSSLHTIADISTTGRVRRFCMEPGERLNRDFILRFQLGGDAVSTCFAVCDDETGEGTWQLTLVPPIPKAEARTPRDVVFILDRSGSMGGWKLVAARRAVARMVDTLTPQDRFSALAFASDVSWAMPERVNTLKTATDYNRFQAISFLSGLKARGGTEMAQPLHLAADLLSGEDNERERIIVLVTDGQIGNEDYIVRLLAQRLPQVRIFALGIDRAVNAGFLERLAALGDGACELVESEERLDAAMDRMHRRIATPIYIDLRLEAKGLEIASEATAPARLPILFDGTSVVVSGRYRQRTSAAQLILHAVDAGGSTWSASVPAVLTDNSSLSTHWARGHVRDLEDQYVLCDRSRRLDLEARIVDTSIRFRVLSRFTAFVAIDRSEQVIVDGNLHRVTQAVDVPDGWHLPQSIAHHLIQTAPVTGRIEVSAQALPYSTKPPKMPHTSPYATDVPTPALPTSWRYLDDHDTPHSTRLTGNPSQHLDFWRQRARELAQRAERETPATLATRLEALMQQLRMIGVHQHDIKPLADALQALQSHLHGTRTDPSIVRRVQTALYAFSESATPVEPTAPVPRSTMFWKANL